MTARILIIGRMFSLTRYNTDPRSQFKLRVVTLSRVLPNQSLLRAKHIVKDTLYGCVRIYVYVPKAYELKAKMSLIQQNKQFAVATI